MSEKLPNRPSGADSAAPDGAAASDPIEAARARVGTWVNEWRLDELLGVGGMATVYAATDPNGARAALKIMHREFVRDEVIRARFVREGRVAAKVGHPGCVQIIDEGSSEEGVPYLVMELLAGETLQERWKRLGRLPVDDALHIARRVLDTLATCHAQGVVHRDLKPGNVFLTTDGRVKLLDFGVAQLREGGPAITRAGVALGTPAYMAPEQAMARHEQIDGRTDVYSVGATLYAVLSGKQLHSGRSDAEAQILAATQPAPSLARSVPELPVQVLAMVDKALQWNRGNRFQSAVEMRDAIAALASEGEGRASFLDQQREALDAAEATFEFDWEPHGPGAEPSPEVSSPPPLEFDLERAGELVPTLEAPGVEELGSGALDDLDVDLDLDLPATPPAAVGPPAQEPIASPGVVAGAELALETADTVAGPAQPESAAPPPQEPLPDATDLGESRQSVEALFACMDRLLRTGRQYGPGHPETQSRVGPVHHAITEALAANPSGVRWTVLPFSFAAGDVVWEPEPPGDLVPYTLSVAGLREVSLAPGVTEGETRELMGAMMVDANSDPAEIATMLWETQFVNIYCRVEDDLGAEDTVAQDDLWSATDDLEQELQQFLQDNQSATQRLANAMAREDIAEAAVMAAAADKEAARCADQALALDDVTCRMLAAGLVLGPDEVRQRHLDVTLDALADAAARRDPATVALALGARSKRLLRMGREQELFDTHRQLLERLAGSETFNTPRPSATLVTHAMFTADALRHVVRMGSEWRELIGAERSRQALAALARITRSLGPTALQACLRLADATPEGGAQSLLLDYVFRVAPGREQRIIEALPSLSPIVAQRVLARLLAKAPAELKALARPLLRSPHAALRCEALAHLSDSHEQLTQALMTSFAGQDVDARLAALDTFVRHRVLSAGPALVREIERDAFRHRPVEEQRKVFEAVFELNPMRAERLLTSIVAQHGIIPDEVLDRTRTIAVELLARRSSSDDALTAVDGASRRRPWNSAPLRAAAAEAAGAMRARRGEGTS